MPAFREVIHRCVNGFRRLSQAEVADQRPLRLKVVKATQTTRFGDLVGPRGRYPLPESAPIGVEELAAANGLQGAASRIERGRRVKVLVVR